MGVTNACLKEDGCRPVRKDELKRCATKGERRKCNSLTNHVGIGSEHDDLQEDLRIKLETMEESTGSKVSKGDGR